MKRSVEPDNAFDINKYAELLQKAQGERTQTEFAKDAGLSVAYVCKSLNKKIAKVPLPSTIKKIANCAANDVTYEELLESAGYDAAKLSSKPISKASYEEYKKLAFATITSYLSKANFEWTTLGAQENIYDFSISISSNELSEWHFIFLPPSDLRVSKEAFSKMLYLYFGKLLLCEDKPNSKLSFVTNSKAVYELVKQYSPKMLAMYVSVILIDISSLNVIVETYLDTSLENEKLLRILPFMY